MEQIIKNIGKIIGVFAAAVALSLSTQAATLKWDANPADEGVKEYHVFFVNGTTTNMINVGTNLQHSLTNLVAGRDYTLFVTAFSTNGLESIPSATLPYQFLSGPPAGPILLASSLTLVNNNQWLISLNWAANPATDGVKGYYVSITQGQNTLTNHFTTSLSASFTINRKNNTRVYLQATNMIGLSSETPVLTLNQPGQVKNILVELP